MHGVLIALALLSAAADGAVEPGVATCPRTADSPTSPPPASVRELSSSYRSQILIADAAGCGFVALGVAMGFSEDAVAVRHVGLTSLALAAPTVHLVRGHPVRALGSLGLGSAGARLDQYSTDPGCR